MSAPDKDSGEKTDTTNGQEIKESLRHMDALFVLAQVLTLDAEKASRLVESTYLHAHNQKGHERLALEDRRHLLQLLLQIYRHQQEAPKQLFAVESENEPASRSPSQDSFKQRLLDHFLKQAVPVAFATMNHTDRIVLTLCDVERLSCADAALIVGGDSDTVCNQLESARNTLRTIVAQNAPPAEALLLEQTDTREWIPTTLRRTVKSEFTALPPTLEPRIKSSIFKDLTKAEDRPGTEYDRKPTGKPSSTGSKNRMLQGLMAVVLILGAGMVGYFGSALLSREPESNLVNLSVLKAPRVETMFSTTNLPEAEAFVQTQMNWRLNLPEISESTLSGVGISEIADGVRVPVFLYEDNLDQAEDLITIYTFTYALLDRFADRIELENDVLTAIAGENHFDLHDLSDKNKVLIWRNNDDIFMAVTSGDARALRQRITLK